MPDFAASRVGAVARAVRTEVASALRPARPALGWVTGLGWAVVAAAGLGWGLGRQFGWVELTEAGLGAALLFILCALLAIGRTSLRVELDVAPQRVVVGRSAGGEVRVTNRGRRVLLPIRLELPIGAGGAVFNLPLMRPGTTHDSDLFVVPTTHRGVIDIGPARTVRGDPLGLFRRVVAWTGVVELFVHPVTVPIEALGAGLLRDLEGQTSTDLSMSDLAFHALREYQPGDDRRYIHWRSSAKAGRFLVRQFLDTRRSHVSIVVDSDPASYADARHYELAVSAAASVAVRAVLDGQDLTVLAGSHAAASGGGRRMLDAFSRAELDGRGLGDLAPRAARLAPDTSIALLVTGPLVPFLDLQRASAQFPPEVRTVVLRIDPRSFTAIAGVGRLSVLTLSRLDELPGLLAGGRL